MADIFGYERDAVADPGQVISSDHAVINIGGKLRLVQNVTGAYQHRVEPKFEAGSPNLYWVTGQASGTLEVGRLLGKVNGPSSGTGTPLFGADNGCGILETVVLNMSGKSCSAQTGGAQSYKFSGAVVQSFTISFGVGNLEVTEGLRIMVAELES